jgi:hypothetical protein
VQCSAVQCSAVEGAWPDIFKEEYVTPVPKVFPPLKIEDLRNISGLLTFNKIAKKCVAELMIEDMKSKLDPSQYANQKGIGIQHYLIKMLNRITTALDSNSKGEANAVLATLIDWKQAFPRQCPKLGVEAFIQNGVRPALIPMLTNYFQNRSMRVKWKGIYSSIRQLNGGGPQGATFGILEYLAQSNDNANNVREDDRFKFVDDLTILEVINLLSIEITSYDFKAHVPNDIPVHNGYISKENLKSQKHLSIINTWTKKKKMILNKKKTKNMIFNFTKKHQFTTRLIEDNENIQVVSETKLLGTIITNNLKWDKNTDFITKSAYKRMQLLNKVSSFTKESKDLKQIYMTFVRPVVEQSAVVWHSQLTEENMQDIERVQKTALRIILGQKYKSYENALQQLSMQSLKERRDKLCIDFALRTRKNSKMKDMFPLNKNKASMKTRNNEKYEVQSAKTNRQHKSTIPFMQRMLNAHHRKKSSMCQ